MSLFLMNLDSDGAELLRNGMRLRTKLASSFARRVTSHTAADIAAPRSGSVLMRRRVLLQVPHPVADRVGPGEIAVAAKVE